MPCLVVETNVPTSDIPEKFPEELTSLMAAEVGKPEKFVAVHVKGDQLMTFGGSRDRAAICSVRIIGNISLEENTNYTKKLMAKLQADLKIEPNRVFIFFRDVARSDCGWNNKTFAT